MLAIKNLYKTLLWIIAVVYFGIPADASPLLGVSIEKSDIRIKLSPGSDFVQLGTTKAALIGVFGKPQSIEKQEFESISKKGELIRYNGNNFYFVDDKLIGFELVTNAFSVGLKSTQTFYAIGNGINKLPAGYKVLKDAAIFDITDKGVEMDENLIFYLSPDKTVTLIRYWST